MKTKKIFAGILFLLTLYYQGQTSDEVKKELEANQKVIDADQKKLDAKKKVNDSILISFAKKELAEDKDKNNNLLSKLVFLNAYNFSSMNNLKSNYVWQLGLLSPDMDGSYWGFNAGFVSIDYSLGVDKSDNTRTYRQIDNVTKSLLDVIKVGDEYYKQLNEYSIETKNSSFSVYAQPLFNLTSLKNDHTNTNSEKSKAPKNRKKTKNNIYAHAHFELYNSKYITTNTIKTIAQESMIYNPADNIVVRANLNGNEQVQRSSLITGYFGLGLTFYLQDAEDNWAFFVQPTIGESISAQRFYVSRNNQDPDRTGYQSYNTSYSFYLVRANIAYNITPAKTALIIGTDIRGFFKFHSPQYAIYAGFNLAVEDILKIFDKK